MDGSDHGGTGISVTSILIVLLSLGAFYVERSPLKGSRPSESPLEQRDLRLNQAEARLWQDPFSAVAAHERQFADADRRFETKSAARAPEAVRVSMQDLAETIICSDVTDVPVVLGVTVFGGRYFESIESRRRIRYAVVSGLATQGYYPKDPERIRYTLYHGDSKGIPIPPVLPFEEFHRPGSPALDSSDTVRISFRRGIMRGHCMTI